MNRAQRRAVTIVILVIAVLIVGVYALFTSGVLAYVFDPDGESAAQTWGDTLA
jgi:hypothetical protein